MHAPAERSVVGRSAAGLRKTRKAVALTLTAGVAGGTCAAGIGVMSGLAVGSAAMVFAIIVFLSVLFAVIFGAVGLAADGAIAAGKAISEHREIRTREKNPVAGAVALAAPVDEGASGALSNVVGRTPRTGAEHANAE